MIKVGDKLPAGSVQEFVEVEGNGCSIGPNSFDVEKATDGKKIAVFALPGAFTLGELQAWCEQVLDRRLDKSSFRRKLAERELVEPIEGEMKGGAFRPAQLFRERG